VRSEKSTCLRDRRSHCAVALVLHNSGKSNTGSEIEPMLILLALATAETFGLAEASMEAVCESDPRSGSGRAPRKNAWVTRAEARRHLLADGWDTAGGKDAQMGPEGGSKCRSERIFENWRTRTISGVYGGSGPLAGCG
jgi:hypothetical protein